MFQRLNSYTQKHRIHLCGSRKRVKIQIWKKIPMTATQLTLGAKKKAKSQLSSSQQVGSKQDLNDDKEASEHSDNLKDRVDEADIKPPVGLGLIMHD